MAAHQRLEPPFMVVTMMVTVVVTVVMLLMLLGSDSKEDEPWKQHCLFMVR